MSGSPQQRPQDAEEVDGLPVLAQEPDFLPVPREDPDRLPAPSVRPLPVLAAISTGFVAGVTLVSLLQRRRRRRALLGRGLFRRRRAALPASGEGNVGHRLVQVVGTRSLLVDVHLLGRD